MRLSIIGSGHVGLVAGAAFTKLGHEVVCVDNDTSKIERLKEGILPFYEPGLEELVKGAKDNSLFFSTSIEEGVNWGKVIFIAVGTPPKENGEPDLSSVEEVARNIALSLNDYRVIVEKSTVPVQTGKWIRLIIERFLKREVEFDVACNPEFLREGTAIGDFLYPDRIVLGVETERAKNILLEVYAKVEAPKIITDINSAELIKHASNAFLAMKISFINAIARICDKSGADVREVTKGIGLDKRIGKAFLNAGIGFGGFCFPKDISAFMAISNKLGYRFRLLEEVERINEEQKKYFISKLEELLWNIKGKEIGVLGLSFKANTDDIRFSPALAIISLLKEAGVKIKAYDPKAKEEAKKVIKDIEYCDSPYGVAEGADALLILTEWPEFTQLDFRKIKELMRQHIILDGRNILSPNLLKELGFIYQGIGIR